jgi:hypothetical protein
MRSAIASVVLSLLAPTAFATAADHGGFSLSNARWGHDVTVMNGAQWLPTTPNEAGGGIAISHPHGDGSYRVNGLFFGVHVIGCVTGHGTFQMGDLRTRETVGPPRPWKRKNSGVYDLMSDAICELAAGRQPTRRLPDGYLDQHPDDY